MDPDQVAAHRGVGVFGPAYEVTYRNDSHAPGSVDRAIQENMILLCPETVDYLYQEYTPVKSLYEAGSLPTLEGYAVKATADAQSTEERVAAVARFTCELPVKAGEEGIEETRFGGSDVGIIEKGSDWCTDLARVGAALLQVLGIPARLVALADTEKAYTGHMITEAYRGGVWGAVDVHTNVVYRLPDGVPGTTWDLKNDCALVENHHRGASTPYTYPDMFKAAAVTNYFIWRWEEYDYTVSGVNDYYRAILGMADKGWPGGLRWLHGEDQGWRLEPR